MPYTIRVPRDVGKVVLPDGDPPSAHLQVAGLEGWRVT